MTMKGRKPKPTARKKLEGNPGKRKINRREPQPRMSADIEPMLINAIGTAFRNCYWDMLHEMRILTDADVAAFEMMAVHYAFAFRAAQIVEREGLIIFDQFGQLHKHPAMQILRDNSALFKSYAAEFGMTPSARSRIQVPLPNEMNQLELDLFGAEIKVGS
jgi:P27 family predicted phage terminase small subunit